MNIKSTWDDVTLGEYQQILAVETSTLNEVEKEFQLVQILSGAKRSDVDKLSLEQYRQIKNDLAFLSVEPEPFEVKEYYTVRATTYKLVKEVKELSAGQFVDISSLTKDENGVKENLHQILAVLLIPAKKIGLKQVNSFNDFLYFLDRKRKQEKYLQTPFEETATNLLNMPIREVLGIANFFTNLSKGFQQASLAFLETRMKKSLKLSLRILKKKKIKTEKEIQAISQVQDLLGSMAG